MYTVDKSAKVGQDTIVNNADYLRRSSKRWVSNTIVQAGGTRTLPFCCIAYTRADHWVLDGVLRLILLLLLLFGESGLRLADFNGL